MRSVQARFMDILPSKRQTAHRTESQDLGDMDTEELAAPGTEEAAPSLLGLPGELRNRIYRLVLVEENRIDITPASHQQPALLRTSRQVRHETTKIYCEENYFQYEIISLKLMLPLRSSGHWYWTLLGRKPGQEVAKGSGIASWSNLKAWLKLYLEKELPRAPQEMAVIAPWLEVVVRAFDVVDCMTKLSASWEDIEQVVDYYKMAVDVAAKQPGGPWMLATA